MRPKIECTNVLSHLGFYIMTASALTAVLVSTQSPALEYVTYAYQHSNTSCNIDGYYLGSEFRKVIHNYSPVVGFATALCNLLLLKHILMFRMTGSFAVVFCFFFLVNLPVRLVHFALQMIEFDIIGGEKYTWLLTNRTLYPDCGLFEEGRIGAVFLMHTRALFLTLDFITMNVLVLTVSFTYSSIEQNA